MSFRDIFTEYSPINQYNNPMHRYPEQTIITIDDLRNCGWKAAIEASDREGYSSIWQSLSAAARDAIELEQNAKGKGLWLLADACSMMLNPNSPNEPFKPYMVMNGKRSSLPEDLPQLDVTLLSEFAEEVDDVWLQARLADLVWLLILPRSPKHALLAIDAYRKISLDTENWLRGGSECWARAISLTRMLKSGAPGRMKEIETDVIAALNNARHIDGYLALWLADLLETNRLGQDQRVQIGEKLEASARYFDLESDLHKSRDYFDAASKWFQQSGDVSKSAEMISCFAEGWVKEAIERTSTNQPSHLVATNFYENAIQTYRTIPRSERVNLRVDERIVELHKSLNEAGTKSLSEMSVVKSQSIDILKLVESAVTAVAGKTAMDAMAA